MDRPRSNDDREGTSNIYQKMSYFLESLKTDLSNGLILKDNGCIPVELLTNVLLMLSGSVSMGRTLRRRKRRRNSHPRISM